MSIPYHRYHRDNCRRQIPNNSNGYSYTRTKALCKLWNLMSYNAFPATNEPHITLFHSLDLYFLTSFCWYSTCTFDFACPSSSGISLCGKCRSQGTATQRRKKTERWTKTKCRAEVHSWSRCIASICGTCGSDLYSLLYGWPSNMRS